jgi:uncharacterized protein YbjT (DUF2867 family)
LIRAEGVVRNPFPELSTAPIHEADIAAVAVEALTKPGHQGAAYTMTGSEPVTNRRMAELIGEAIGRPVRFETQSVEEYRQAMSRAFTPEVAEAMIRATSAAAGAPAFVTDAVREVTGRRARTFADWAADHAADFTA